MMMIRLVITGGVVLSCIGCGTPGASGIVSGEVTVDGQPLAVGMVSFEPLEGGAPRYIPIQNGKYEARGEAALVPGSYRVRITGSDAPTTSEIRLETLDDLHAQEEAEAEIDLALLPAAWNTASNLTVEVEVGRNTFHFRGGDEPTVSSED